jgi:purine-binding chemotaxis protein CheW
VNEQLVVFRIGNENYGLDIGQVLEIIRETTPTTIPLAPSYVKGVIDLRGDIVTVLELHGSLGIAERKVTNDARIIVLEVDQQKVGIMVDAVIEVACLTDDAIQPPPKAAGALSEFVEGIARTGDEMTVLISLSRLLKKLEFQSRETA